MTTLTDTQLLAVAKITGTHPLPGILTVTPHHESARRQRDAEHAAIDELIGSGSLDPEGNPVADLAAALHILALPERRLIAHIYSDAGIRRICLARKGFQHALAIRSELGTEIHTVYADADPATLAAPFRTALGTKPGARIPCFSAPSAQLKEYLDTLSRGYSHPAGRIGLSEREALEFATAMRHCRGCAEIVAYGHRDGVATRSRGAVAVYDTDAGRIVASPSLAPDGRVWSTFAPGSDHRLRQSISMLIETLPEGRWLPPTTDSQ
ncbi:ESX secretion-associated protein EspG [Nocardia sp. NPDC127526]|uniref:ESX secretion-associated protein EspG n=1 Tax=Nocardia sp. NPDC127526 TaxID=3345393 RepID=UPI00363EE711